MRTIVLCFVLAFSASAEWGQKKTTEYTAWITPYSNHLPSLIASAVPPSPSQPESGAVVTVSPIGEVPDAFEVTLRYVDGTGKVLVRTQVLSNNGYGMFGAMFRIGQVIPLSISVRSIAYSSLAEH